MTASFHFDQILTVKIQCWLSTRKEKSENVGNKVEYSCWKWRGEGLSRPSTGTSASNLRPGTAAAATTAANGDGIGIGIGIGGNASAAASVVDSKPPTLKREAVASPRARPLTIYAAPSTARLRHDRPERNAILVPSLTVADGDGIKIKLTTPRPTLKTALSTPWIGEKDHRGRVLSGVFDDLFGHPRGRGPRVPGVDELMLKARVGLDSFVAPLLPTPTSLCTRHCTLPPHADADAASTRTRVCASSASGSDDGRIRNVSTSSSLSEGQYRRSSGPSYMGGLCACASNSSEGQRHHAPIVVTTRVLLCASDVRIEARQGPVCPVLLEDLSTTTTASLCESGVAGEGGMFLREVDASGFGETRRDADPTHTERRRIRNDDKIGRERLMYNSQLYLVPTLTSPFIPQSSILDGAIYNLTGCTYDITHSTGYHRGLRCHGHQLDAGHVGRGMPLGSPPTRRSTSPRTSPPAPPSRTPPRARSSRP
ncbi:hypothetical protein K438DRAFT_1768705 [Mycena galopus ATCC 62051]|nr:hypothetical protein K438DRAFT_1768705 [Mycena galopus ATCC 62051]